MPNAPQHDPTPEQIAAECAKIRETWNAREERKRRGVEIDNAGRPVWNWPTAIAHTAEKA